MEQQYRFQDTSLSPEERAEDLLLQLTTDEKIAMITSSLDAIPRLGIPATHFGVEIARGVVQRDQKRETTILPQPWGMAASFDAPLMEKLGDMAGDEVRICSQMEKDPSSLVLFGPTVDMERDPRWGRNEEAYGEDPCLTGEMTVAYTKGLAGYDQKYLKTAPILKHFYANNYEDKRQTTNAGIPPRLKREYYLKAFEPAIRRGGAVGVMTAYNCINGVEGVNNPEVTEIGKKEWGMPFALSDGGDFGQNVAAHRSYQTHAQSIADILGTGADLMLDSREMVDPAVREALETGLLTMERLNAAVKSTLKIRILLGDLDPQENPYANTDVSRLANKEHKRLAVQMAEESMILLENKDFLPLRDDGRCRVAIVGPLAHENYTCWYCGYAPEQTSVADGFRKKLGTERVLCEEGFDHIILKSKKSGKYIRVDENGCLLADEQSRENAEIFERNDWDYGSWLLRSLRTGKYVTENSAEPTKGRICLDPPLTCTADRAFGWFVKECLKVTEESNNILIQTWQGRYVAAEQDGRLTAGTDRVQDGSDAFEVIVVSSGAQRVKHLAGQAEFVLFCAGNHPLINAREEYDRPDINLPKAQGDLLAAACAVNSNTLLYLITGYPFSINRERELVRAVLASTHLGPCLGDVAARTVFGENNPAGRTPTTWYRSVRELPDLSDYDIQKNKMTYLYYEGKPLYPFGYGKSYTSFAYGQAEAQKQIYTHAETIEVCLTIQNTGDFDGDEVVQLYVRPPKSCYTRPRKMLRAFRRVSIQKGESVKVMLSFPAAELAFWSTEHERFVVESGTYEIEIGASSEDIRTKTAIDVAGEVVLPRNARLPISAIDTENHHGVEFLTDKNDSAPYLEIKDFRSFAVYATLDISGCNSFEALVSTPSGSVDILLADDETGEILGGCTAAGTGSRTYFVPVVCRVQECEEPLKLRIVMNKQASLKSFHFFTK